MILGFYDCFPSGHTELVTGNRERCKPFLCTRGCYDGGGGAHLRKKVAPGMRSYAWSWCSDEQVTEFEEARRCRVNGNHHTQLRGQSHNKCKTGKQWREVLRRQTNREQMKQLMINKQICTFIWNEGKIYHLRSCKWWAKGVIEFMGEGALCWRRRPSAFGAPGRWRPGRSDSQSLHLTPYPTRKGFFAFASNTLTSFYCSRCPCSLSAFWNRAACPSSPLFNSLSLVLSTDRHSHVELHNLPSFPTYFTNPI